MPQPHRDNPDNEVTHSNPTAQAFQSIINTDNASYQTTAVQSFVELYQRLDLKDHPGLYPVGVVKLANDCWLEQLGPHLTLYWRDPAPATESDTGNTLEERPIQCLKLRLPGEAPWPTLTPRHEALLDYWNTEFVFRKLMQTIRDAAQAELEAQEGEYPYEEDLYDDYDPDQGADLVDLARACAAMPELPESMKEAMDAWQPSDSFLQRLEEYAEDIARDIHLNLSDRQKHQLIQATLQAFHEDQATKQADKAHTATDAAEGE